MVHQRCCSICRKTFKEGFRGCVTKSVVTKYAVAHVLHQYYLLWHSIDFMEGIVNRDRSVGRFRAWYRLVWDPRRLAVRLQG